MTREDKLFSLVGTLRKPDFFSLILNGCHSSHQGLQFHYIGYSQNTIGVVNTMALEVVPSPRKIWDWMLNSSWDHCGLHQGKKKCQSDHEV